MALPEVQQPPYPLHDSVKHLLDPEYVDFYNQHLIDRQQVHLQPVAASRTSGVLIPGAGPMLQVGKTHDLLVPRQASQGPAVPIRVFTPPGQAPANGWPVMLYFHGGGWVLGNINTENVVCSNLCVRGNCVVITVDYRLAPEDPFPAAVHDSWEALLWLVQQGPSAIAIDASRMATGGSSAGGNLAAVMTHKALTLSPPVHFQAQLLSVPVTDNTATVANNDSYRRYERAPALPAAKMMWYRNHYLPEEKDRTNPEASPLFYDGDWSQLPPALVMVGELDVLRVEGEQYAEKLSKAGVSVNLQVMKGMPHPFLAMDGVLKEGKRCITLMCDALQEAFWK
ncbi:Alpha/beta hydrolase fold-3 domain-containing protein [Penicillium ucsense]|uniref:Alpha/beta hydrolase fold-3 domain-containing protein n=1 Tax=Penicillium ucsense TaxID=2839758 RepID=A0A8J8WN20_9EURO|nr:Alpha/beta hydrolase fold-3 domain-containing protein [Penicillium ucsense]KAF7738518.1 Alpha/beta hydrolase fold-3 domain-containing protein [Penicillium ucsense]